MSPHIALYLKELKGIRLVSAVLVVATVAIVLVVLNDASDGGVHASMVLLFLPYLSPPVLAGVLIHSITQEWSGNTQHQWLALPVPRAALLLTKVAAVLTLAAAVFLVDTFAVHMIYEQVLATVEGFLPPPGFPSSRSAPTGFDAQDLWAAALSMYGSITVLLLGLGLAAATLKTVASRFLGLITVSVFLGGLWLTSWFAPSVTGMIGTLETGAMYNPNLAAAFDGYLYMTFMGVAFGAAGIFIFDRYADA